MTHIDCIPAPALVSADEVAGRTDRFSRRRALALNFAPGLVTVALIAAAHPAVERLGWPPVAGYTAAITVVTMLEWAYLARFARHTTGRWRARDAVTTTAHERPRRVALVTAGFVLLTAVLAAALGPVADAIGSSTDRFVPDWLSPATDHAAVATYGRVALAVALALNLVIDALINPYIEELYWKGHLMDRLPVVARWQPVALGVLFALEHLWQPADLVLVAVVQVALSLYTRRHRSLDVAIATHWIVNGLVSVTTIVSVLR